MTSKRSALTALAACIWSPSPWLAAAAHAADAAGQPASPRAPDPAGTPAAAPAEAPATVAPQPWPRNRPTPPLTLPGWDAPAFELQAARGQVVLLNFWASWCEPCRSEMPSLELLAQRLEGQRVQIVAVNYRETDATMRRFLAQWPITLPIARDADGAAARAFGVRIFPTTVAVARDGRAVFSVVGEADWTGPDARRWIAPLL